MNFTFFLLQLKFKVQNNQNLMFEKFINKNFFMEKKKLKLQRRKRRKKKKKVEGILPTLVGPQKYYLCCYLDPF